MFSKELVDWVAAGVSRYWEQLFSVPFTSPDSQDQKNNENSNIDGGDFLAGSVLFTFLTLID